MPLQADCFFWFDPGRRLTSHGDKRPVTVRPQRTPLDTKPEDSRRPPCPSGKEAGAPTASHAQVPPCHPGLSHQLIPSPGQAVGPSPLREVGPSHSAPGRPQCPRGLVTPPSLWLSIPPAQLQLLPSQEPGQTPQVPQRPSPPSLPTASRLPSPVTLGAPGPGPCVLFTQAPQPSHGTHLRSHEPWVATEHLSQLCRGHKHTRVPQAQHKGEGCRRLGGTGPWGPCRRATPRM